MVLADQNTLLDLMKEKFGGLPEEVERMVRAMGSTEEIRPYLRRILHAGTLDEMGFPTNGQAA